MDSKKGFLKMINISYDAYLKYGARSNKKVNIIHNWIKNVLCAIFPLKDYKIECEVGVKSINYSGYKRCDIVVKKRDICMTVMYVFPVKFITSNYKQNRNNYLENLIGESYCMKKHNSSIKIIPFNIFLNETPYRLKNGKTKRFEKITKKDFEVYEKFKNDIFHNVINLIVVIDHKLNKITNLHENTPYISLRNVITRFSVD